MFSGSEHEGKLRRDAFERYLCRESGRGAIRQPLTDVCAQLICSMSAVLHNGALCMSSLEVSSYHSILFPLSSLWLQVELFAECSSCAVDAVLHCKLEQQFGIWPGN